MNPGALELLAVPASLVSFCDTNELAGKKPKIHSPWSVTRKANHKPYHSNKKAENT
jgi:hypothetical protein